MCSPVLSGHVWLGRGRARVLAPIPSSLHFPSCQPLPLAPIMSQGRELGFSCGPEVLPGDIMPRLSALSSLTLLSSSPLPLSFWKSQNSRPEPPYPAGRLRRAGREHPVSESRGLGLCPNQISVLGHLELGLYSEPSHFNTADDRVDLETPFLQKCWCKSSHLCGEEGWTMEGSLM